MCQQWCKLCCVLFTIISVNLVICFNIETYNHASYQEPNGDGRSMFGFSVAIHKEGNNGWVIVGAPEAQSYYQRGKVHRGGVVFKCPTNRDGGCQEIPFDTKGNNLAQNRQELDNKTEQWLGATVSTSGTPEGPVVACAPRYTWFPRQRLRRDPVGTCFVSDGAFQQFNEYSPCRTYQWGYHRQGSCQAGFSAAINSKGDRLFVGSPGSWYWQGQMYSIDAHAKFEFTPLRFSHTYGAEGQVHQQSLANRPAVFSTREGSEIDDDSYMGYSTITGQFSENGEQGIAVGMPRGSGLHGKVLLFTWDLTNYKNFSSDQIGSYFGYSLAAADVDGDGKVDLIVGAPMYTVPNNEEKYDVGRVYVIYHQSKMGRFSSSYAIDGFNSKSRFGHSLAALGDINQDGFGDFAVGAPYDGENGRGAVYIYHGSDKGVREKYSQVIFAEEVGNGLSTFGFSIAGGLDLDQNNYPDMAVGAYLSNTAFFFRSRPVVRVEAYVEFLARNKQIDIKAFNYQLKDGKAVVTDINFCIKYYGDDIPRSLVLNLQYILDSKKTKEPRMGFVDFENMNIINETIRLLDNQLNCQKKQVYIKSEIRDKLTPLEAEVKYWMQDDSRAYTRVPRDPNARLKEILDLNSPPSRKDVIYIQKNCGTDNICVPNLNLKVTSDVDQYMVEVNKTLKFDVIVSNLGEDSFETMFYVKYPKEIHYQDIQKVKTESLVSCTTTKLNDEKFLKCEIGNPIPAGKIVRFEILWQPNKTEGMAPSYEFDMNVNSTNEESEHTRNDNHQHLSVGVWVNAKLDLYGKSVPNEVFYNASQYSSEELIKESDIGPQVIHLYYLTNKGPSRIEETEIFFVWPSFTFGGEDLLYLLEQPQIDKSDKVKCDIIPVNKKHYEIDYKKSVWDRLKVSSFSESWSNGSSAVRTETGKTVSASLPGEAPSKGNIDDIIDKSDGSRVQISRKQMNIGTQGSRVSQQHSKSGGVTWSTEGSQASGGFQQHANRGGSQSGGSFQQHNAGSWSAQGSQSSHGFQQHANSGGTGGIQRTHGFGQGSQSGGFQQHHINTDGANLGNAQGSHLGGSNTFTYYNETIYKDQYGNVIGTSRQGNMSQADIERLKTQKGNVNYQHGQSNSGSYGSSSNVNYHGNAPGGGTQGVYTQTGYGMSGSSANVNSHGGRVGGSYNQGQYGSASTSSNLNYHGSNVAAAAGGGGGSGSYNQGGYDTSTSTHGGRTGSSYNRSGYGSSNYSTNYSGAGTAGGSYNTQGQSSGARQHNFENTGRQSGFQTGGSSYGKTEGTSNHGGGLTFEENNSQESRQKSHHQYSEGESSNNQNINIQSGEGGFEQIAAGKGFRTSAFGLESIGNSQSGHQQASSNAQRNYGQYTGQHQTTLDLGNNQGQFTITEGIPINEEQGRGSENRQYYSSQSSGQGQGGGNRKWKTETHWSQSYDIPVARSNHIKPDTVAPEQQHHGGRAKRQTNDKAYEEFAKIVSCETNPCIYVRCLANSLGVEETIQMALRARVNVRLLRNVTTTQPVTVSSMMAARISKLPFIGTPTERNFETHEIITTIPGPEPELKPDIVPLWVVVLSAVAGTIILLLLIFLLYKFGFFKRNRPSSAPERQPLKGNGYHHGDEHL